MSSIVRNRVSQRHGGRTGKPKGSRATPVERHDRGVTELSGRCLALGLLLVGWPIVVLTVVAVRLTSRGPAIYRQTRVGRNGRHYVMYKIRTMRVDAEAATGAVWTQQHDPRITRVGRLIRKLHLDEFPQLVNVLKGEMALVGPRPERPEFTHWLAEEIPGYLDRLAVLPGITGLAQINLPPDTDVESVRRKLALDLVYVEEGGWWLDMKILACTFARLFSIKGPRVTRLFGVERTAPESGDLLASDTDTVLSLNVPTINGLSADVLATDIMPKTNGHATNGHAHKTNGHTSNGHGGPWSHEVRRRPK